MAKFKTLNRLSALAPNNLGWAPNQFRTKMNRRPDTYKLESGRQDINARAQGICVGAQFSGNFPEIAGPCAISERRGLQFLGNSQGTVPQRVCLGASVYIIQGRGSMFLEFQRHGTSTPSSEASGRMLSGFPKSWRPSIDYLESGCHVFGISEHGTMTTCSMEPGCNAYGISNTL